MAAGSAGSSSSGVLLPPVGARRAMTDFPGPHFYTQCPGDISVKGGGGSKWGEALQRTTVPSTARTYVRYTEFVTDGTGWGFLPCS